jgi:hemoglobin
MPEAVPITEAEIATLVDRFYDRARQHPLLGPVFADAVDDWDTHLATLRAFWSSVMLTSGRYKGNPMAAHMRHPIRPELFEIWLALFGQTADEVVAPELARVLRQKSERIAESLRAGLFFEPARRPKSAPASGIRPETSER